MLIFISLILTASGEKGCATKSMLDYTFALPDCDQWLAKEKEFSCLKKGYHFVKRKSGKGPGVDRSI